MIRSVVLTLTVCMLMAGCQAGYYGHLARGHMALMSAREPVDKVLARQALTDHQRSQLLLSQSLLEFADRELALPASKVYRHYVPLQQEWVVWNLFAAPEFSLTPYQWCYPVAGCAGYRGYFNPERAHRDARRLEQQGLDVHGAGAIAYSTLGWFRDPLTSAMLLGDDLWFAELLFHELVHRHYYLKGDTRFNESLATAVAREGVRRWLAHHGDPGRVARLEERDQARAAFLSLVSSTRDALQTLYQSGMTEQQMRVRKASIIQQLRDEYQEALSVQPGLAGYREWFAGPLNNAQLNMVSDYHDQVPLFDAALLACGGHWPCFWAEVERLARLAPEQRAERNDRIQRERLHD
jgi:predicted aminopeptidase